MRGLWFSTILVVAGLASVPAFASGGLSCTPKDKKVQFTIESGVTRGMGAPVFNFRGQLTINDKGVAKDLSKTSFGEDHLAQYWLDGEELRLLLYRERDGDKPHGYVEMTILTKVSDENTYSGTYDLMVYDTVGDTSGEGKRVPFSGKTSCFVE